MPRFRLENWEDIKDNFADCLLLGNGASIAIDSGFSYRSLLERAKQQGFITTEIDQVFRHFDTKDFEYVLRMVWHTYHVNQALGVREKITLEVYERTREALIQVVQNTHVDYDTVTPLFPKIAEFLKNFQLVLSLNYDLILYWAILWANEHDRSVTFKDCFSNGIKFDYNWERFFDPIPPAVKSALVFYPHGNLVLASNLKGNEVKITRGRLGSRLLDRITEEWNTGKFSPLFVSEGNTEQKLNAILRSGYLSTVYNSVLPPSEELARDLWVLAGC